MTLGERIKELRETAKMTQLDLAEKLFVSDKTISKWEGNKSEPEINILVKICDLFNVTLDYLTTGNMHMDKMDAVSKIELACREDNIALLDGINIKLYDSSGKDIYFYAEKYKAKNILKYLNDMEFDQWISDEKYKKNKKTYVICAIPEGLEGEDNLILLRETNIKENITKDCVDLEKKGYHHFKIFSEKEHYEKCPLNYQWFDLNVLNDQGEHIISIHFGILDDNKSGYLGMTFHNMKDKSNNQKTLAFVKPNTVQEFVDELDAIDFNSWKVKYWGCPLYEIFYTLKKEEDDKTMLMYYKKYIAPNKMLYKRFLRAVQNLAFESLRDSWYKLFITTLNTSCNPYYREGLNITKSKEIFESIEKEMKFDNVDIKEIM